MKIPYNILIQIKMSVRPYFKGFTLIFFFYNCRKQDFNISYRKTEQNIYNFPNNGTGSGKGMKKIRSVVK